ncbi:hypothetical protein HYFRA_00000573 [Hymenoscyphus fraxineus]|uniref:AB hydrolase-1 domain-containing protein n=1 Tax=Hymenoscyphus fraxineus TaxID=746836 RepID=A0A9N9PLD0_9HELO|nr:hypothetical protein HYFRA_00000573 [Hymenoscyphus fraxineus]
MSKPTIVMFVGAFHQKEHLKLLLPLLENQGYKFISETLETVDKRNNTRTDDIAQKDRIFTPLFKEDKDVVLVVHSYAGIPGSAAIKGLSKAESASNGLLGGIIGVVYESAFIPQESLSLLDMIVKRFADWQTEDKKAGLLRVPEPIPVFYNGVPDELAQWAASIVEPHSLMSVTDKLGPIGYQDTGYTGRLTYIRTECDHAIPAAVQDDMIEGSGVNLLLRNMIPAIARSCLIWICWLIHLTGWLSHLLI